MEIAAAAPVPERSAGHEAPAGRLVPWSLRDVLAGVGWFVASFVGSQIAVLPLAAIYGAESNEFYAGALAGGIAFELSLILIAVNLTVRRYGGGWSILGLARPGWRTLRWAAFGLLLALGASYLYAAIIQVFGLDALRSACDDQIPIAIRDERWLLVLVGVTVVGLAPVCEELFFRAFFYPGVARAWGVPAGIIVAGIAFSLPHLIPTAFIPIGAVGIAFAFSYHRSGTIFSTMLAHLAFNTMSFALIVSTTCEPSAIAPPWLR